MKATGVLRDLALAEIKHTDNDSPSEAAIDDMADQLFDAFMDDVIGAVADLFEAGKSRGVARGAVANALVDELRAEANPRRFDHRYEPGAFAVCRRCGADAAEHDGRPAAKGAGQIRAIAEKHGFPFAEVRDAVIDSVKDGAVDSPSPSPSPWGGTATRDAFLDAFEVAAPTLATFARTWREQDGATAALIDDAALKIDALILLFALVKKR